MTAPARRYFGPALLVLITFAAFSGLLRADFTSWDDYNTIARNWRMRPPTFDNTLYYWRHAAMDLYIPVTYTVWSVIAAIANRRDAASSLNPVFFHAANIAIHASSVLVVYTLIRRLLRAVPKVAFLGACVFAIHPLQVEAVAWVSGTKDLLCGLFSLLALLFYSRRPGLTYSQHADHPVQFDHARISFVIATLFFLLAMLCKPTAIVLPLMAIVIDHLILYRPARDVAYRWIIWLILVIPCVLWTHHFQPASPVTAPPLIQRPLVAADAISFYLGKLVFPINLCVDYGRTPASALAGPARYTWIIPVVIAVLLATRARRSPYTAGTILFLIPLLPVLGLVPFDFQTYSTVADHYLYVPMFGVSLAVAWLCMRQLPPPITTAVILLYGFLTIMQVGHWRDTTSLFSHVLTVNPRSFAAQNSLAAAAIEDKNFTAAESHGRAALADDPDNVTARVHLAAVLAQTGDKPQAVRLLRQAISIDPASAPANINLGGLLADLGDPSAESQLRRAITLATDDPSPYQNLGALLASQNRLDEARENLFIAKRLAPGDARIRTNYAIVLAAQGHPAEAAIELRRALQIDPNFAPARQVLSDLGQSAAP